MRIAQELTQMGVEYSNVFFSCVCTQIYSKGVIAEGWFFLVFTIKQTLNIDVQEIWVS